MLKDNKNRARLEVRQESMQRDVGKNFFSNRVGDTWNKLSEEEENESCTEIFENL